MSKDAITRMRRSDRNTHVIVIVALVVVAIAMLSQNGDVVCDVIGVASLGAAGLLIVSNILH